MGLSEFLCKRGFKSHLRNPFLELDGKSSQRCWSASHPPGNGARAHLYRTRPENRIEAHGTLPGRIARYSYDAADRLTRETEDPWTQYWRNWSRELPADAQSALAPLLSQYGPQSTGGRQETQYTQDPSDNLTARKGPAGQWTGTPNGNNQYTHAAGSPWQYDLAGNLLDDGKRSYGWDAKHRLISITDKGNGKRSEFAYDGQSRLSVIREYGGPGAGGVETRLLWCEDKVCQKRDNWDRPLARYLDEGEIQQGRTLYYVRDHLGSIRDLVSATGSPLGRMDYGPYGEEEFTGGEVSEHRYAGMFRHGETGFYITHYRIYDPWMGRWLSRDPIGEAGGVNLYAYANGNPISLTDPDGLSPLLPGSGGMSFPSPGGGGSSGLQCSDPKREKNCAALRDNIINQTCKSITNPRKKMACFAAAWATYLACLSQD
jgi:RHS repeat-associated protein